MAGKKALDSSRSRSRSLQSNDEGDEDNSDSDEANSPESSTLKDIIREINGVRSLHGQIKGGDSTRPSTVAYTTFPGYPDPSAESARFPADGLYHPYPLS